MALSKSDGAIGILLVVVGVGFSIMASRSSSESSTHVAPKAEPVASSKPAGTGGPQAVASDAIVAAKPVSDTAEAAKPEAPPAAGDSGNADKEAQAQSAEAADLAKHEELRFPVAFVNGNAKPVNPDLGAIAEVATKLKDCSGGVLLVGHSDSQGGADENHDLSQLRAEQVAAILVQHGIAKERIAIEAAGSTRPVLDNASQVGRQANRRVTYRCK